MLICKQHALGNDLANKLLTSVLAAVVAAALAAPAQADIPASAVTHFTLSNGLEVVVIPDRRAPVVTHMLWYKVGSADEVPGKSGLAHFLEHLLFKGTEKNPAGRFSQVVATIGGNDNAFTTVDYTGYIQRVPRAHLKTLMEFESDRMTGLVLLERDVQTELKVVLEEQNTRVANSPAAQFAEQMDAALFLNHPYGRPIIGWRHEIERLTRADALAFYRRHYGPNNAVLVVAGDVDPVEVKALAEETYGKVERVASITPRVRPQEPVHKSPRRLTLADPRVEQPSVQRLYLVPSSKTARPGESEALELLAHIIGSGTNSRLYQALVVDQRLAVSAGAWYHGTALDHSRFSVHSSPRPGTTLTQIEEAIDAVLAAVIANGVTADELERAKNRMIAASIYALDNQATMARWFGAALMVGLTVDHVRTWPSRIRKVTADEIRDAARQWLDNRRSVTGYLVKELPKQEKRS
jgi:zinc protease